jgi:hypothetical protein
VAAPYEDTKIREYGDIKEYSNINKRHFWYQNGVLDITTI